ncbi:MAG: inosine/xanthosine triphosphatase [Wenzhouxiangellaceae bacterium]
MKETGRLGVVIASTNPVKRRAVETALSAIWPARRLTVEEVSVSSGVPEQPVGDEQTRQGAWNRACNAARCCPHARLAFGIEGGVEESPVGLLAFAWVAVVGERRHGWARSPAFVLPEAVARRVRAGVELGQADDEVFGQSDSKRSQGAIGLLTRGVLDRAGLYRPAVIAALAPFLNPELYPAGVRAGAPDSPR